MDWGLLLLIIFLFSIFLQLIYQWFFLSKLIFYKQKRTTNTNPLSVVICARNEYINLEQHLPEILEQEYPEYEVVVVNDRSNDKSQQLLEILQKKYDHLNVINLNNSVIFFKGKKFPLSIGIKSSKYNTLVLTDADCRPASPFWLKNMQKCFSGDIDIVLGHGAYEKKKGLLNTLIRYDTLTISMNYFSFALAGLPYMGTGRNLAYKKDLFYKANGFTSHYKIRSGDDDLFINQVANRENTTIEINPDSFTYSRPKESFKEWFIQKKRHFSTGKYYKKKHKILLGLLGFSHFSLYLSFILLILLLTKYWMPAVILFGVRTLGLIINYYYNAKKFKENKLFLYSLIYDMFFALLNPIILISNIIYKTHKWK